MTNELARILSDTSVSTRPKVGTTAETGPLDTSFHRARLAALVEQDRVDEARSVLSFFVEMGVDVGGWARALAPPAVLGSQPRSGLGDLHLNSEWVAGNRDAYVGKWVALRMGQLVAADADHGALVQRLNAAGVVGALIRWIEP